MIKVTLNCQYQQFNLSINQALPCDQIIGLYGASGSGKSKFIRQICGLDKRFIQTAQLNYKNSEWVNSKSGQFLASEHRGIGYLPQSVDLFPHLNVEENIRFSLNNGRLANHNNQDSRLDFDLLVNTLNLKALLGRMPWQISGGQKQRVGLARAIIASKNLLLLDEPFSAQDDVHKSQIMSYLKMLNQTTRLPIVFASHNRIEHAFLSQNLMTFEQGTIVQSGIYDDVATDINGSFAQTTDAVNHIVATAEEFHAEYSINLLSHQGHSIWAGNKPLKPSTSVLLEIKATDISVSKQPNSQSSILNCLPVRVVNFTEINQHQFLIKLAFAECFLTTFITKKSLVELAIEEGMSLFAQFKSITVLPFEIALTNDRPLVNHQPMLQPKNEA